MLEQHLVFTSSSGIQFFNSPPFHSQLGHLWYPTTYRAAWNAMSLLWSPSNSHSTLTKGTIGYLYEWQVS